MPKALMKKVPISEEEFLRKIGKMYGEYAIEEIACHMKSMYIRGTGQPCLVLRQPDTEPICLIAERSPKGLIARMDMMPAGFYRLVSHPGKKE